MNTCILCFNKKSKTYINAVEVHSVLQPGNQFKNGGV